MPTKVLFRKSDGKLSIWDLKKSIITALKYYGENSGKFFIEFKTLEGKIYKYDNVSKIEFEL